MKKMSILFVSFILLTSCCSKNTEAKEQADNSVSDTVCNQSEIVETKAISDTLLYRSTVSVDGKEFIVFKVNPENTVVTMADAVIPKSNDSNIALCVAGAFTSKRLPYFETNNVLGDYVIDGVLHKGSETKANTGFIYSANDKIVISSSDKVEDCIKDAKQSGGMLLQQMLLLQNGKNVYKGTPINPNTTNYYRAACIMTDGSFAVIQSKIILPLKNFISSLSQLGVSNALYLDMGGWKYGWYRETKSVSATKLFEVEADTKYQTNWLVIKAKTNI